MTGCPIDPDCDIPTHGYWETPAMTTPDQPAPDPMRERLAVALSDADQRPHGGITWGGLDDEERGHYYHLADAALSVLGDSAAALARVEALAEELASHRGGHDADVAELIRAAIAGTDQ